MGFKINWDAMGIGASLACAIHCAILPLFLSSLSVFGIEVIENKAFEIFMIVLAFGIGVYSLLHGYRKHHHRFLPLAIFTGGFVFLVLKQVFMQYEYWLLAIAVIGIVTAHYLNYRLCRKANHCHVNDCAH
jgi:MerC mercury resistance protein